MSNKNTAPRRSRRIASQEPEEMGLPITKKKANSRAPTPVVEEAPASPWDVIAASSRIIKGDRASALVLTAEARLAVIDHIVAQNTTLDERVSNLTQRNQELERELSVAKAAAQVKRSLQADSMQLQIQQKLLERRIPKVAVFSPREAYIEMNKGRFDHDILITPSAATQQQNPISSPIASPSAQLQLEAEPEVSVTSPTDPSLHFSSWLAQHDSEQMTSITPLAMTTTDATAEQATSSHSTALVVSDIASEQMTSPNSTLLDSQEIATPIPAWRRLIGNAASLLSPFRRNTPATEPTTRKRSADDEVIDEGRPAKRATPAPTSTPSKYASTSRQQAATKRKQHPTTPMREVQAQPDDSTQFSFRATPSSVEQTSFVDNYSTHQPTSSRATAAAVEPTSSRATASAVEPSPSRATASAVEPSPSRATASAVEHRIPRATASAVEPESSRATASAVEPDTSRATAVAVEHRSSRATASAVEHRTSRATASAGEPTSNKRTRSISPVKQADTPRQQASSKRKHSVTIAEPENTPRASKTPRHFLMPSTKNRRVPTSLSTVNEQTEISDMTDIDVNISDFSTGLLCGTTPSKPRQRRTVAEARASRLGSTYTPTRQPLSWEKNMRTTPSDTNADRRFEKMERLRKLQMELSELNADDDVQEMQSHRLKRVKVDDLEFIPHNRPGDSSGTFRVPDIDSDDEMEVDFDVPERQNVFQTAAEMPAASPYHFDFPTTRKRDAAAPRLCGDEEKTVLALFREQFAGWTVAQGQ
ncbi:hypothetical protein LTR56_014841 [Elasticomyces elasticus]|nr:hypothetical protein LTR56_014841 [Elasticomyces elasticus]KAK3644700.1 hypothetical protein LTR22_015075 [Elasticomyces elasticus]KAK4916085.1 hypothetical protein LTR49_015859 [Elasticomyces elasticus]KAK5755176.1 hypothetical protein LTS12_014740 [Elasticomyces elasticus]